MVPDSPAPRSPFGARLRQLRLARGLSQEELAEQAGLAAKGIGALERGERRNPYPGTVRALAEALNLSADERAAFLALVAEAGQVQTHDPVSRLEMREIPLLPFQLIGRDQDAQTLETLLCAEGFRFVTLTGPGGVGKTSLAVDVAHRVAAHFIDGAIIVDFAPVMDPSQIIETIAHALGLQEGDVRFVSSFLRNRKMLVVLDNLEHLLSASPDFAGLLAQCPSPSFLATSRAPLRIRGEREYQVSPLAMPDTLTTPDANRMMESSAVQLFVQRAQDVAPTFALTDRNAAAIAGICWKLEGLPLALELAAAQIGFLAPMELFTRLDEVLQHQGARDLPRRQRTMRATLEWSYGLLSDVEQTVFRRLSVFAGGFELDAAEALGTSDDISQSEALGAVRALVEHSLVVRRSLSDEATRYYLLEPTRQYALSKLEDAGEERQTRRCFAAFYVELSQRAMPELRGADQARWLDRLARDFDNLRSVRSFLVEQGDSEAAIRLAWALWSFWSIRGHASETRVWLDRVLERSEHLAPEALSKGLWLSFGLALVCGDLDSVKTRSAACVKEASASNDPLDMAHAHFAHGIAALLTGDLGAARRRHENGLDQFRALGNAWGEGAVTLNLGLISLMEGDLEQAASLSNESAEIARNQQDWFSLMAVLNLQAAVASGRGDENEAEVLLLEGLSIAERLHDVWSALLLITGLAGVATRTGDFHRAARLFGAADAIRERTAVTVSWSIWRDQAERDIEIVLHELGSEVFDSLRLEGRRTPFEDLVAGLTA